MKPWEFEANAMVANSKCSPEDARIVVILRWMYLKGDLIPTLTMSDRRAPNRGGRWT